MTGLTLGRYFAGHFLRNVVLVFALFMALIVAVDLIDQSRTASQLEDAPFLDLLLIALLRAPVLTENILPFAVLFGSIGTLVVLNRRLELVVARASGVSVWQFLAPAIATAIGLGLFAAMVYNPLALTAQAHSLTLEAKVYGKTQRNAVRRDYWVKSSSAEGTRIISARVARDEGRTLDGVIVNTFDADGRPGDRVDAALMTFDERRDGNVWIARDALVYADGPRGVAHESLEIPANITAERLARTNVDPREISFWDLQSRAAEASSSARSPLPLVTQFHALASRPLLYTAMVLLAGTVSLRFARFGIDGWGIAIGVVFGFVLYACAELALTFGRNGAVAPLVAAWGPVTVATLLGTSVLLHQEDG